MSPILHIWQDGQSALFLVGDTYAGPGRQFRQGHQAHGPCLDVLDAAGYLLAQIALSEEEWAALRLGRAHWLECNGQDLVLDLTVMLT